MDGFKDAQGRGSWAVGFFVAERTFQMSHRILVSVGAVIAVILLAAASFAYQGRAASSSMQKTTWTAPRTVDGQPDLQGVWNFSTLTPLERPAHLAGRAELTNEEVAEI